MKIKKRNFGILIILFLVMIEFGFASLSIQNYSIKKNLLMGEKIDGWINFSFSGENPKALFTNNLNRKNVSLIDFLLANNFVIGRDFNCTNTNCEEKEIAGPEINSMLLAARSTGLVAFKISGNITNILSTNITISSNAQPSSMSQIEVDVLNRREFLFGNRKKANDFSSGENYGCFRANSVDDNVVIGGEDSPVCMKLAFAEAPAYKIGAKVKNSTNGIAKNLTMRVLDGTDVKAECILRKPSLAEEKIDCDINLSSKQKNYTVCIFDSDGESAYEIKKSSNIAPCEVGYSFEIFNQPYKFAAYSQEISDNSFYLINNNINLSEYIKEKIIDENNGVCNPYCLIIFGIKERLGIGQTISFSNARLEYKYRAGNIEQTGVTSKIFSVDRVYPLASSNRSLIANLTYINFSVPYSTGEGLQSFILYYNGLPKIVEFLNISNSSIFDNNSPTPQSGLIDIYPKQFLIKVSSSVEVINATSMTITPINYTRWRIDNRPVITSNSSKINILLEKGNHTIYVEVFRRNNVTVLNGTFEVEATNANLSAYILINQSEKRIKDLNSNINSIDAWIRTEILKKLNISQLNQTISDIKRDYIASNSDDNYTLIIERVSNLSIPVQVGISKTINGPLVISTNNNDLDIDLIEEISGKNAPDPEKIKNEILKINSEKIESNIELKTYSKYMENGEKTPLLTYIKISVRPKERLNSTHYLIINQPFNQLKFKEDYSPVSLKEGSAAYIRVGNEGTNNYEFIIEGDIQASDLDTYISPVIDKLEVEEEETEVCTGDECKTKGVKFNTTMFLILLSILIVVFGIIGLLVYRWYKKNYENYLFKKKEDLYNLVSYIYNCRNKGTKDEEIKKSLRNAGWSSEQINYAFKKVEGKRTGM